MAESGLLLYCIASASSPMPSDSPGGQGGPLQRISHGELVAVVAPVSDITRVATPSTDELLAYERVIRAHHAVADVVPMRFGSVLSSEAAVRAHLEEQRVAYLRSLTRTAGCVEMGVRTVLSAPRPPAPPEDAAQAPLRSGADYLKARQRRYSAESQLLDQCAELERSVLSKVAPLCREHRSESPRVRPGEPVLCSLYFLVPRDQVPAFRAALAPFVDDHTETVVSGPWPPFNFVD